MATTLKQALESVFEAPDVMSTLHRFKLLVEHINSRRTDWRTDFYSAPLLLFLDRLYGEGRGEVALGSMTSGFSQVSGCRLLLYERADEEKDTATLQTFDAYEIHKCKAAASIATLLDALAVSDDGGRNRTYASSNMLASLGLVSSSIIPEAHRRSLFAYQPSRHILIRKELCPPVMHLILNATQGLAPFRAPHAAGEKFTESWLRWTEWGGERAERWRRFEPVLSCLLDKVETKVEERRFVHRGEEDTNSNSLILPEIPTAANSKPTNNTTARRAAAALPARQQAARLGVTGAGALRRVQSPSNMEDTSTVAASERSSWPDGLYVPLRNLLLMYFTNYAISTSKRYALAFPVTAIHDNRDPQDPTLTTRQAVATIRQAAGESLALLYRTDGQISGTDPYLDLVYQYTNKLLSMHDPFPISNEAPFFLSCVESYWLLHNPPSLLPIPEENHTSQPVSNPLGVPLGLPQERQLMDGSGGWMPLAATSGKRADGVSGFGASLGSSGFRESTTLSGSDYKMPQEAQLEALSVVLLLQTCDKIYPKIISGEQLPPSGGVELATVAQAVADSLAPSQAAHRKVTLSKACYERLQAYFPSKNGLSNSRAGQPQHRRVPSKASSGANAMAANALPGPKVMPIVWSHMQFGLFNFLRIHLQKLSPAAQPHLYGMVVDVWLTVLTPWRSRDRHTGNVHVPTDESRCFNYSSVALSLACGEAARDAAANPSAAKITTGGVLRIPSVGRKSRAAAAESEMRLAVDDLSNRIRKEESFASAIARAHDFANKLVWHAQWDDWKHYVTLHYSYYTYLLGCFARAVGKVDLAASYPFPILSAVERVVDVYEPQLMKHLTSTAGIVDRMFDEQGSRMPAHALGHAANTTTAAANLAEDAVCMQLLAHLYMIEYPRFADPRGALVAVSDALKVLEKVCAELRNKRDAAPQPFTPPALSQLLQQPDDEAPETHTTRETWQDVLAQKWKRVPEPLQTVGVKTGKLLQWLMSIMVLFVSAVKGAVQTTGDDMSVHAPEMSTVVVDEHGRMWPSADRLQFLLDRIVCLCDANPRFDPPRQLQLIKPNKSAHRNAQWTFKDYFRRKFVDLVCFITGLHPTEDTVSYAQYGNLNISRDDGGFLSPETKRNILRGSARIDTTTVQSVLPRSALPPSQFEFAWLVKATHNISDKLMIVLNAITGQQWHYAHSLRDSIREHMYTSGHQTGAVSYLNQALSRPPNILRPLADWRVLLIALAWLGGFEAWLVAFRWQPLLILVAIQGLVLSILAV